MPKASESPTHINVLGHPRIQIDRANFGNVNAEGPMHSRTSQADKDAQVGRRPAGILWGTGGVRQE